MPYSHHSHSGQFCRHGSGTLEDVVKEAIKQRFKLYCLTEHCPRYRIGDLYPEEVEANDSPTRLQQTFQAYLDEAVRLKKLYSRTNFESDQNCNGTEILVGLETECIRLDEDLDRLTSLIQQNDEKIDFVVVSVHHSNEHPIDFSKETFEKCLQAFEKQVDESVSAANIGGRQQQLDGIRHDAITNMLKSYFTSQRSLLLHLLKLQPPKPLILAHFDLPRLFLPSITLSSHASAYTIALDTIHLAVQHGVLFEISSAPLRKGWSGGYPGEEIVKEVLKAGGKFVLSDDAHGPKFVGLNYGRLRDWAEHLGVESHIWRLTQRDTGEVIPVKVEKVWDDTEFWDIRS